MPKRTPPAKRRTIHSKRIDADNSPQNKSVAMDYFTNLLARTGMGTPSIAEAASYELERLSLDYWLMITLYRNQWIPRRIVDLPAIDMTRAWPSLVTDVEPDDLQSFERTIRRTRTSRCIRQAIKWARLFGGGGAVMCVKGHEKYLDQPLDLDDVTPGSYLGLIPFDPWVGIYPTGTVTDNIKLPQDWGLPETYEVRGPDNAVNHQIHASRVLRFLGPEVPTPEYQAQRYWGISVLELVWEELRKRDNASWAILNLIFRAQLIAQVNPDLAQLLSGLGATGVATQKFWQRMEAVNQLMSNQSTIILPKDGAMQAVQYSFAGMAEIYAQFQMDVAGAAEMTVTKLFGRTITGLGQSNEADERMYEQKIAADQDEQLHPQLDKLYPVIAMSEWGEVPDDMDLKFPSVRVLSEEEKADLVEKASAPILAAYNSGILWKKTVVKELKQLSDVTGIFSNITEEEVDAAEEEPLLPEMPGEGGDEAAGVKEKPNPQRALRAESGGAMDARPLAKRIKWHGLDISIENRAGSRREGVDEGGHKWSIKLMHDYGYLRGTQGVDGDHVDCFIGLEPAAEHVYVIHTMKAPHFTDFDEDKCMLNFRDEASARAAFFANYDRPEHFGSLEKIPVGAFIDKVLATKDKPSMVTA